MKVSIYKAYLNNGIVIFLATEGRDIQEIAEVLEEVED